MDARRARTCRRNDRQHPSQRHGVPRRARRRGQAARVGADHRHRRCHRSEGGPRSLWPRNNQGLRRASSCVHSLRRRPRLVHTGHGRGDRARKVLSRPKGAWHAESGRHPAPSRHHRRRPAGGQPPPAVASNTFAARRSACRSVSMPGSAPSHSRSRSAWRPHRRAWMTARSGRRAMASMRRRVASGVTPARPCGARLSGGP